MPTKSQKSESSRARLEDLIQALNRTAQSAHEEPSLACAAALTLAARYAVLLGVDEQMFLSHAQSIVSEATEQRAELGEMLPPSDSLH